MSDLVERLRALRLCRTNPSNPFHYCPNCDRDIDGQMLEEAAAEIARLREANRALVEAAEPFVAALSSFEEGPMLSRLAFSFEEVRALSRAVEAANE